MESYQKCYPLEVSMKSLFLGPKAENGHWLMEQFIILLNDWFLWRKKQNPADGAAVSHLDQNLKEFVLKQKNVSVNAKYLSQLFENEIPQFSPRYIGHMFSEVNLPAMLGHFVSFLHNPNIISHESAKVGIKIENEAIQLLNAMIGFTKKSANGHFTSGGTVANFESLVRSKERVFLWALMLAVENKVMKKNNQLWQAASLGWKRFDLLMKNNKIKKTFDYYFQVLNSSELKRMFFKENFQIQVNDPVVLIPRHKHYSWIKGCSLIALDGDQVRFMDLDKTGKIDIKKLDQQIQDLKKLNRPIQQIVSVLGTTELGFVDPTHEILTLLKKHQLSEVWYHIDAAYGGFFATLKSEAKLFNKNTEKCLRALPKVTSLTIDPHKMGYVPYSSGAFLCANNKDYYLQSFFGPYVAYDKKTDKGPFTLEGSRPATGAASMWMTAKSIPLNANGMGKIIKRTVRTKLDLEKMLPEAHGDIRIAPSTDLNIVCFCVAKKEDSILQANKRTSKLLKRFSSHQDFIVSQTVLHEKNYAAYVQGYLTKWSKKPYEQQKVKDLLLIRVTVMNPFFDSKEFKVNFKKEFVKFVSSSFR